MGTHDEQAVHHLIKHTFSYFFVFLLALRQKGVTDEQSHWNTMTTAAVGES